jgi:hypothetical protein
VGRIFWSCHRIHSWDLDVIVDKNWVRVLNLDVVGLVGIHSWDFNISDETTVTISERHLLGLIAA